MCKLGGAQFDVLDPLQDTASVSSRRTKALRLSMEGLRWLRDELRLDFFMCAGVILLCLGHVPETHA
jgi:hypothetical protein